MENRADIGIIGALEDEVAGLISMLSEHGCERLGSVELHTGGLFGKRVVVCRSGVGKVFAALAAEAMIIGYAPSLIVNTGVGGALDKCLNTGDVVIATSLVQHDMDTSPLGDPKGLVSGINKIYFDTDARAVKILEAAAAEQGIHAISGRIASGDRFVASAKEKRRILSDFSASACEMEGAAIAQVAYVNDTPFAVIRAISDSADGEASMDYPSFLPLAVRSSLALTLALIEKY